MLPVVRFDVAAVLFDLDGVLADSAGSIERAWRSWAKRRGIPWSKLAPAIHGRQAVDTIRVVLQCDEDRLRSEAEAVNALQVEDAADVDAIAGMTAFVESLPPQILAVATSAPRSLASARLARRGIRSPDVLVCAEDVTRGKPDPEAWLAAAEQLGASPSHCLVIEDSPAGIAAGLAASMDVIAVASTHPPSELSEATVVVQDARGIRVEGVHRDAMSALVATIVVQ